MIEIATGLILRTRPLTETSLIVQWLTPDFGRIATVAKGARRPKSPFRGKLDLFYRGDFSFVRSRRSELHALREVELKEPHSRLRQDLQLLQQASYCAALIEQATETETPLPEIFELMRGLLESLAAQASSSNYLVLGFELKFLRELGQDPDLTKTRLTAGAKELVGTLLENDWQTISTLSSNSERIVELRKFLHGFIVFHLGKVPRGHGAAHEISAP